MSSSADSICFLSSKVLQDAILRYLDTKPEVSHRLNEAKFQLVKDMGAKKDMMEEEGSDSDSECDHRSSEILSYKVQVVPPENVKFEIMEGLSFEMTKRQENGEDKKSKWIRTFILTSEAKDAQVLIDGFVDRALDLYKSEESNKKDESRYLYTPLFSKPTLAANDENSSMMFKRYKLSEEKTFTSFFHPEKEALLHLLDNFSNKKGKFAVPGYPHKLGLLLHGPPGTGKTSLIKALANHTKRNIISIPLSRVRTNQDLMDLVLDQACKVEGDDWTYKLPFKKTIFVMEDIDAAADVVHKRSELDIVFPMSMMGPMPKPSAVGPSPLTKEAGAGEGTPDDSKDDTKTVKLQGMGGMGKFLAMDDELNLAGILNVLDGVIDCPNRLVVMTTNHPDKLDPALIRPGRINKKLYLGLLRVEEAKLMMEHYYGPLEAEQLVSLKTIFPHEKISPAAMECLCAECDTLAEFFVGLNKLIENLK